MAGVRFGTRSRPRSIALSTSPEDGYVASGHRTLGNGVVIRERSGADHQLLITEQKMSG